MKLTKILTACSLCMLLVAVIGCGEKNDSSEATDAKTKVEEKAEEATEAVAETFEATKEAFVTSAKTTLESMDSKIADAKEKADALPKMAKNKINDTIENLEVSQSEAHDRLADVENADEAAFEAATEAYTTSVKKLETSLSDLTSMF